MKKNIKLNLGCGGDYKNGWVNVDALENLGPDLVHDLRNKLPFQDGIASDVLCQDILEHFTKEELPDLLADIARVLEIGGRLVVRVPNVDEIFEKFSDDKEVRNEFIYGTTSQTGVWGAHKVGFTPESLIKIMLKQGLEVVEIKNQDTNLLAMFIKNSATGNSTKIKNLSFINQTLGMGGAEVFNTDLLVGLKNKGIIVNSYVSHKNFAELLKKNGFKPKKIPVIIDIIGDWKGFVKAFLFLPYATFFYAKLAWRLKNKTDLILLTGFSEKILLTPWAKLFGVPVVWIEFGPLETVFKKFLFIPKILYRLVKDLPEKVLVPSENTKNHLIDHAKISLAKIEVLPCGRDIDLNRYKNIIDFKNQTLVCVSRLEKGKGQDLLIHAFKIIQKKFPKLKLLIVGEGSFKNNLEKIIKNNNLEKSVELVGRVDDSLEYLKKATICIFPSVWPLEGFGLVVIEAMAMSKPIIAFNRGPTNEIISHKKNGLLAEECSIDDLAEKIIELLKNRSLRLKLGKQARKDFQKNYLISSLVDNYISAFEDAKAILIASKIVKEKYSNEN